MQNPQIRTNPRPDNLEGPSTARLRNRDSIFKIRRKANLARLVILIVAACTRTIRATMLVGRSQMLGQKVQDTPASFWPPHVRVMLHF